jgi:hypothetical protein
MVRSLLGAAVGHGVPRGIPIPMHGVVDRIRGHRVRGACVCRLDMREHVGGKALPADLDRERPVACRHEPRRNEHTRRKRDQQDAGHERLSVPLAGAQAHLPGFLAGSFAMARCAADVFIGTSSSSASTTSKNPERQSWLTVRERLIRCVESTQNQEGCATQALSSGLHHAQRLDSGFRWRGRSAGR